MTIAGPISVGWLRRVLAIVGCLALGPFATQGAGTASEPHLGTVATPIERRPPKYPTAAEARGDEGWVIASFVIGEDGTTGDILIEDSNGISDFERAARHAIRGWKYEPATLGGEPTEQCHTKIMMPFALIGPGDPGARHPFRKRYKKAMKAVKSGEPHAAQEIVDDLRTNGRLNLYESARLAFLESFISEQNGDSAAQVRNLSHATLGSGEFIESDIYRAALRKLFALQVKRKSFRDALSTYNSLEAALDGEAADPRFSTVASQIRDLQTGTQAFRVDGVIGPAEESEPGRGRWAHRLLRRNPGFVFDDPNSLEEYDLRCEFKRAKGKPESGTEIQIPKEWGDCHLYISGRPGTKFQLIEYGSG